ncbi:GMC family oxidoreductase [Paucibacter sp. B2R-40]|uniref:GMC family oxidoreductase n=1 Tax=Paucibacter sp. B2R-40 TaxID=2893554 RepID=UPI0021E47A00|nr:GMC family oxidoreductase [Paucibacter sp. B2R-40]MCV2356702.1 GMC family oxidoreductase [Paucibacter sp. B2R-40]
MSSIADPIKEGLARGWKVLGQGHAALPPSLDCDVAIVGSGAGAGITAELLAKAGLKIIIIEEGPLRSSSDFKQRESTAYAELYQEGAGRKNADQSMNILQGRCVGGSTTVNWTGSFRTPPDALAQWVKEFGLSDCSPEKLAPWFEQVEKRLNISDWLAEPNGNNDTLRRGTGKLGISSKVVQRNVKGCWNLGSCGMGCPTNAKQSMLITTIPAALDLGATLLVQTRAQRFNLQGDTVQALICQPVGLDGSNNGPELSIKARHFVVAGGAINSPALLLRSHAPDPQGLLGTRTFLHPTVANHAQMPAPVEGWAGAPLSVFSDHFLHQGPVDGPMGFKLEVAPVHPGFAMTNLGGVGPTLAERAKLMPYANVMIGLLRDGFHAESIGGTVSLKSDGTPQLAYPLNAYLLDGARRAHLSMTEIQFAAGAKTVRPVHELAQDYSSWAEAKDAINKLPYKPFLTTVGSAHVMGGCRMAADAGRGVVRPDGQHWQLSNLSVHDGSIFPTSIGANPQVSVYGQAARMATGLAKRLTAKDVLLA